MEKREKTSAYGLFIQTPGLNIEQMKEKINNKTKAILVVHMFGHPAEMDPIIKVVKRHKLYLIEDAAEAHGAGNNKRVGSFGDQHKFRFLCKQINNYR